MTEVIEINHFSRLYDCVPPDLSDNTFLILYSTSPHFAFPSLASALLALTLLLLFFLISLPLLYFSHLLLLIIIISPMLPSLSLLRSIMVVHAPNIFPLHGNAPPHHCSLCFCRCRRLRWNVELHRRRLYTFCFFFHPATFSTSVSFLHFSFSLSHRERFISQAFMVHVSE